MCKYFYYIFMEELFTWMTHGENADMDTKLLQKQYFIGNKRFRDAGIALEDHSQDGSFHDWEFLN